MNSEQNLGEVNVENAHADTINIKELLNKYLYHWPVFVLGVFLALSIAVLYLRYTKPIYEVNSTLLIKDEKKGMSADDLLSQLDLTGGSKVVENEIEILKSKTLMAAVVERLNLDVSITAAGRIINSDVYEKRPVNVKTFDMQAASYRKEFKLSFQNDLQYILEDIETGKTIIGNLNQLQKNDLGTYKIDKTPDFKKNINESFTISFINPTMAVNANLSQLSISIASKQSTVLNLSLRSTLPEQGKDILNTLIQVYNEAALADKNRTTQSTIHFIDERLSLITGELVEVEKDVEGFKSTQGLTDISSEATLYLENVRANDAKLNEVNLQLGVVKGIKQFVASDSPFEKIPSTLGIDDPVLLSQIKQLSELQQEKISLLATTQPNNPMFEPINLQIDATRTGIKTNINNIERSLQGTLRGLTSYNSQYESSIKKIPGQERKYISIKRQQTIKESLYLYLLQKKEEAALDYASTVADSRVVDAAIATPQPIKPKKQITFLAAILFGLLIPVGYIYVKDLLNNKINSNSDISRITKAPILGEIMLAEGGESIVVQANSRKAIAEQFRAIRTNMQFLFGKKMDGTGNVTLFTSSFSGEGKSFVASNVAAAMAISGRKTILLELDLRKPKISKYLSLNNTVGFSHYLIGKANINDIIQPSGVNSNLFVIGSGPIPPNPSELLIELEIEELLVYLKANFDEIIIDTPPIGLVTDAQILARFADVSIYLIRQGVTSKEQVTEFNKLYLSKKFPRLNVILNGIEMGGRYGYGYGYSYGYYTDDHENTQMSFKTIFRNILKRF